MCSVNVTEASLGSSNNGAITQKKMWYCRDEVCRGWDLSKRGQREQWEQEEEKCMVGADTGNVSLDQGVRALFRSSVLTFMDRFS